MSDPAIEAAQRYWLSRGVENPVLVSEIGAAREALKPMRELHRRTEVAATSCEEECEIHYDECPLDARVPVCRECFQVAEAADSYFSERAGWDSAVGWPCDTAKLIYATEEI